MRPYVLGLLLTMAVLMPGSGRAQVYQFRTAPPEVNAAAAACQVNSDPVIVGGLVYCPTRGFRKPLAISHIITSDDPDSGHE